MKIFKWLSSVGKKQLALPTFILNYYQIMKLIQSNIKSDSFNYLIIWLLTILLYKSLID